ncbi:MAG: DNA gyrase inhibitor YacG [Candidatus Acidiferrales bacterium]|jgi:endogenous inhibitor of DNA gyrase (YacG/DUF329 family)
MQRRCPICKKPTDSETHADFPFCSERCRLLDLGNWASEKYVISSPAFDESLFEKLEKQMNEEDGQRDDSSKR